MLLPPSVASERDERSKNNEFREGEKTRRRGKRRELTSFELVRVALALLLESSDPLLDGSGCSFGVCLGSCRSVGGTGGGSGERGCRGGGWEFGFLGS